MANFKKNTRYTGGVVAKNRSGESFLVLRKPLKIEPSEGDIFITVTEDVINRPDLIAHKAYGDASLWWAIYDFNGIRDPLFDLKVGSQLRIPEIDKVLNAIEEQNRA